MTGPVDEIMVWNHASREWKELTPGTLPGTDYPEPRYGAASCVQDSVYVFGGKAGKGFFNDLWTYDRKVKKWKELVPFDDKVVPSGRFLAGVGLASEVWVYGGLEWTGKPLNDMWGYDVALRTWRQLEPKGTRPSKLYSHSTFVRGTEFCIHGGRTEEGANGDIYCYEPHSNKFRKIQVKSP